MSILSAHGVRIEGISDLVGHSGTSSPETVYRHAIRPALITGATAMDKILSKKRPASARPAHLGATTPRLDAAQPPAPRFTTRRATPAKPRARKSA